MKIIYEFSDDEIGIIYLLYNSTKGMSYSFLKELFPYKNIYDICDDLVKEDLIFLRDDNYLLTIKMKNIILNKTYKIHK
jgi:hypothetical protein